MKITEIQVKGILNPVKQPDGWFGLKYNMNLYRGCQHRCIYCDSRSLCYQIEDFDREVLVKVNAVELLAEILPRKRIVGTIGTGSMNDPYQPLEKQYHLTGQALQVIAENRFPVHVLTKSDLVLKDIDTLDEINQVFAAVSFTITAADDSLGKQVEPGAPEVSRRLAAMRALAERGIHTGVLLMPVLPFLEDNPANITAIVEQASANGASYILPSFGMTLRDRQCQHYFDELDRRFPGVKQKYLQTYRGEYTMPAQNSKKLSALLEEQADKHKIALKMPVFEPVPVSREPSTAQQLTFDL